MQPNILLMISHDSGRKFQNYGYRVATPHINALAQRGHFHPRKQRVAGRQGRGHLAAFGRLQGVTCGLVNAEGGLCAGQHGQRAEQQQDKGILHACQNNHRW